MRHAPRTLIALSLAAAATTVAFAVAPTHHGGTFVERPLTGGAAPNHAAATLQVSAPQAAAPQTAGAQAPRSTPAAGPDPAVLKQYCLTCHSERVKSGGLALEALDLTKAGADAETWEKVVRKIRTGMMPPAGAPRPTRAQLDAFAGGLEARLDAARVPGSHLESSSLHRLNRTEYANAVRDLLALDVDVSTLLPADGSNQGFDNLAEGLSVSPTLIQAYIGAAMKISRQAVGDRTIQQATITYPAPPDLAQDAHVDGMPLGTRGGMQVHHHFPLDAEYEISAGGGGADITLDGEKLAGTGPRARIKVSAGPHTIGAAVIDRQRSGGADDIYSDFRTNGMFAVNGGVSSVVITGPFNPTGTGDTPSRRRVFTCRPSGAADEATCARKILSGLARRAYRGPVSATETATLMAFYEQGRKDGDFESGIQQAIARILVAPRFLYRIEEQPASLAAGAVYRVSDIDLASRLSFLLWSSIPDEDLLRAAEQNTLHTPAVLRQQVARMLADPKSDALVRNFAGQWLYLRELATLQTDAKNFDDSLRQSFRRETEMLVDTIVHSDRSLIDLLDADYTFVDERLAKHYGIPNVHGSYFRRVSLDPDGPRRGLIGHGSMLTVTSIATRTSPVARGKWILENLFGAPPPQPPPGVEVNLDQPVKEKPTTLRQRMELHRASPTCASCHRIMDPIGFSLENFDLVGTWRDTDGGSPIDPTGQLADGTPIAGPKDLRRALLSRSDAFIETVSEKLLTYAIGRPVRYTDMPDVRLIARRTSANGNRFSALLMGVVESDQFQKRVKLK